MGIRSSLLILSLITLAGCAGNQNTISSPEDYVEIDNPAFTMSPGAPATIWVPRSYVESSVPRGGELVKKGYEAIRGGASGSAVEQQAAQQPAAQQATASSPAPVLMPAAVKAVAPRVRNRIFTVELGQNGLLAQFNEEMAKAPAELMIDPAKAAFVARYAAVATPADRAALAVKLREDFGANLALFLSATEGVASGSAVTVEIFECNGGTLVKSLTAELGSFAPADKAARAAALSATLRKLAGDVKDVASLVPWYGKVVTVEGERVYINAGKESGILIGRVLNVYRGGKVLANLGFAPGQRMGLMEITGYVGTDGAFGIVKQGAKAQTADLVGVE
ncbi:MAG: hypothetical protein EG822_16050 [Deltaproteobacteria bacterium]|nr:hypothetical protein [Deltaproteobacteria bacterium]TLN02847.1 MAG: hypothetical protein FDZ73_10265 [bacterium]